MPTPPRCPIDAQDIARQLRARVEYDRLGLDAAAAIEWLLVLDDMSDSERRRCTGYCRECKTQDPDHMCRPMD